MSPSLWVSTTYFAEGLPYMLVRWLSAVYFTDIGAKEAVIGYLNWLGFPWNWKFLWAPLVDFYSTKRRWMLALQAAVAGGCGLLAGAVALGPPRVAKGTAVSWEAFSTTLDPVTGLSQAGVLLGIVGVLIGLAFLSATHDVAIDAYYIEGLPDRTDQARYSGLRVTAYRLAVLFSKFALVALPTRAWGFGVGAAILAALFLFHVVVAPSPPRAPVSGPRPALLAHTLAAWASYLRQPRVATSLAFIALYKLGDELMFAMNTPFLLRELKVTDTQFAWLSGLVGTTTAIAGSMAGAWWIKRVGLKRALWPLTLAMNLNIWAYVWLARAKPDPQTIPGLAAIAAIHGYEQIAAGLGAAALVVWLLYTCQAEFKAAHYAIGSAIMSLGGTLFGGFTGKLVESIGYVGLYELAFLASIPGMVLIRYLPIHDSDGRV